MSKIHLLSFFGEYENTSSWNCFLVTWCFSLHRVCSQHIPKYLRSLSTIVKKYYFVRENVCLQLSVGRYKVKLRKSQSKSQFRIGKISKVYSSKQSQATFSLKFGKKTDGFWKCCIKYFFRSSLRTAECCFECKYRKKISSTTENLQRMQKSFANWFPEKFIWTSWFPFWKHRSKNFCSRSYTENRKLSSLNFSRHYDLKLGTRNELLTA